MRVFPSLLVFSHFFGHVQPFSRCQSGEPQFPGSIPLSDAKVEVMAVMQKQTGQKSASEAVVGVPSCCLCRHGFPQAVSMNPVTARGETFRLNSGLLKLTCPNLVRACDDLEDEGAMKHHFNLKLAEDPAWREAAATAHNVHSRNRILLLRDEDREVVRARLGDAGLRAFCEAGVAGSSSKTMLYDVKCLHAYLADYLFRGTVSYDVERGESVVPLSIGGEVLTILEARGLDVSGTSECYRNCDPSAEGGTTPPVPRNKSRLRSKKQAQARFRRKHQEHSE